MATIQLKPISAEKVANDLIQLLEKRGTSDYIGESISQLEHSLQCAHSGIQAGIFNTLAPHNSPPIIIPLLPFIFFLYGCFY
jgi:hypothetical protein